jgi:hypothetical protein
MPKKKSKKSQPIPVDLTANQVGHLITGAVKNLIDLDLHVSEEGIKYLLILDCIVPEGCIPASQEPDDEEIDNIIDAYTINELRDYFEAILSIRRDGVSYRGFSTININEDNVADFVDCLSELESYWMEIDQGIEDERDLKSKTEGKNLVEGNGTVQ